jgi:hypothetical protein
MPGPREDSRRTMVHDLLCSPSLKTSFCQDNSFCNLGPPFSAQLVLCHHEQGDQVTLGAPLNSNLRLSVCWTLWRLRTSGACKEEDPDLVCRHRLQQKTGRTQSTLRQQQIGAATSACWELMGHLHKAECEQAALACPVSKSKSSMLDWFQATAVDVMQCTLHAIPSQRAYMSCCS